MTGTPEQLTVLLDKYYLGLVTKTDVDNFLGVFGLTDMLDLYYYFNNIPSQKYYLLLMSKVAQSDPTKKWWLLSSDILFSFSQYYTKAEALLRLGAIIA